MKRQYPNDLLVCEHSTYHGFVAAGVFGLAVCVGEIGVAFQEESPERVHGYAQANRAALLVVGRSCYTSVCVAPRVVQSYRLSHSCHAGEIALF